MNVQAGSKLILLTGATGYIGGRLVPRLLEAGHRVRCLARDPARLAGPGLVATRGSGGGRLSAAGDPVGGHAGCGRRVLPRSQHGGRTRL